MSFHPQDLHPELNFRTSRSSGAGGQHVNKVETRVELLFDLANSAVLTDDQKQVIRDRLGNRLTKDDILIVSSQESRSQQHNREAAIAKFDELIRQAFRPRKRRKTTRPPKAALEARLEKKRRQSEKKAFRGRVDPT